MTTAHADDLDRWQGLPSSTVCDCLNRFQAMHAAIRPVIGSTLLGRAWTARSMPGENNTLLRAIETAPAGSILVVDAGGFVDRAVWGEVRTMEAIRAGLIGLVVDGAVRDVEAIRRRGFTVYARGICAAGPNKGWDGDVGGQIQCAGVVVNPGDLVVADTDGVVVVPRDREEQVLIDARRRQQEDADLIARATMSHR
ncbi:RraA family protein [Streptomyces scopuliridis]|uniref:RraA family protein n=1 Tax=Streptomyces scopuliridis TaxID=452529 RepID=UPI0036A95A76